MHPRRSVARFLVVNAMLMIAVGPVHAESAAAETPKIEAGSQVSASAFASSYPKGRALRVIAYQMPDGTPRQVVLGGDYGPPSLDDKGMNYLRVLGLEGASDGPVQSLRWDIKEASGPLCNIQPLRDLFKVDRLGNAADPIVLVPYWVDCDGLDPTSVKLIVYYQDRKYAVRGSLPNQEGDTLTRTPSANFTELPEALQQYLWDYWAKVEKQARTEHGTPED